MKPLRKRYNWSISGQQIALGGRTLIMGVLGLHRDASAGKADPSAVLDQALRLEEDGADLIEVNADPVVAGSQPISADEELRRLVPVLRKLRHNLSVPLSLNTYNAETVSRAIEMGVQIINDVSGLAVDPQLVKVVNESDVGLILTHMRGTPETWKRLPHILDLVGTIGKELESCVARAIGAGIDRRRIVVDPGLELGKRGDENYQILVQLDRLAALGQPLLLSPSRKHFLTGSVRASDAAAIYAAAAASTLAICGGAHILRVHEVSALKQVAAAADHIFDLEP